MRRSSRRFADLEILVDNNTRRRNEMPAAIAGRVQQGVEIGKAMRMRERERGVVSICNPLEL